VVFTFFPVETDTFIPSQKIR